MKSCYIFSHFHTTSMLCWSYAIICHDLLQSVFSAQTFHMCSNRRIGRDESIECPDRGTFFVLSKVSLSPGLRPTPQIPERSEIYIPLLQGSD